MKRLLAPLLLLAGLGLASLASAADYDRLDNPQPPKAEPGRVVVQQFLWHRCIHCYHLEPEVERWLSQSKPDFIDFERVPVVWDRAQFDQSGYYGLAKVLLARGELDAADAETINSKLFDLTFVHKKDLNSGNVQPLFAEHGIGSAAELDKRLAQPDVEAERVRSYELTRNYRISGVPLFVVNGRYLVGLDTLEGERSPERLFATINRLAGQELRRTENSAGN